MGKLGLGPVAEFCGVGGQGVFPWVLNAHEQGFAIGRTGDAGHFTMRRAGHKSAHFPCGGVVNFLFVAAALFIFLVKFLGWVTRRKTPELPVAAPAPTLDQELLMEIRDLLRKS